MVRQGALASLILSVVACAQPVDDPANFTQGSNSQGNTEGATAGTTTGGAEVTTEIADGTDGFTSTTATTVDPSAGSSSTGPTNGACGNGVIDAGEQCDGAELQGFDCMSLGLNSGTLLCDAEMCTFDTQMCSSTTGGTSG